MSHIIARKGDIIKDYDEKPYATIARDISIHDTIMLSAFDFAEEPPAPNSQVPAFVTQWINAACERFGPQEQVFMRRKVY